MIRFKAGALSPAVLLLVATCGSAPAAGLAVSAGAAPIPVRQACDADGRCYETGDPGYRDDDAPPTPPQYRRYIPDDEPPPPPRRRDHRDDGED